MQKSCGGREIKVQNGMIHIPAKKKFYVKESQPVRISAEAYNTLVDICNEAGMPMKQAASLLILAASELIEYDMEE